MGIMQTQLSTKLKLKLKLKLSLAILLKTTGWFDPPILFMEDLILPYVIIIEWRAGVSLKKAPTRDYVIYY